MVISNTHDYKINWNTKPKSSRYVMYANKIFIADDNKAKGKNDRNESMTAINESFIGDAAIYTDRLAVPTTVS